MALIRQALTLVAAAAAPRRRPRRARLVRVFQLRKYNTGRECVPELMRDDGAFVSMHDVPPSETVVLINRA